MKNAFIKSETIHHTNDSYELPSRNYLNCLNVQEDPRFYDCPRKLAPHAPKNDIDNEKNHSPLQSPTDSDSVFNDEDWTHNTSSDLSKIRFWTIIIIDRVRDTKMLNSWIEINFHFIVMCPMSLGVNLKLDRNKKKITSL